MLLPRWFPFHIAKVSYWARTVLTPLLVLRALMPRARNPRGITIQELFLEQPQSLRRLAEGAAPEMVLVRVLPHRRSHRARDRAAVSEKPGKRAIDAAVAFVTTRLNGEDGLGAIFPAMANTVMMFDVLGYPAGHPDVVIARRSIEKLLVIKPEEAYCQPCVSPVWDTALVSTLLLECDTAETTNGRRGLQWLTPLQVLDIAG